MMHSAVDGDDLWVHRFVLFALSSKCDSLFATLAWWVGGLVEMERFHVIIGKPDLESFLQGWKVWCLVIICVHARLWMGCTNKSGRGRTKASPLVGRNTSQCFIVRIHHTVSRYALVLTHIQSMGPIQYHSFKHQN